MVISPCKIGQNTPMRLDHVSYVASHDQISDVVNRIGSQIGTAFVDGGIHPKFGTRNFTAPLLNHQYLEIVCPLDHPSTQQNFFGKAVLEKSILGGGWLFWVISVNDLQVLRENYGGYIESGTRTKPSGAKIEWEQLVLDKRDGNIFDPYFIQWTSQHHPSKDGIAKSSIKKLEFFGDFPQDTILDDFAKFNEIHKLISRKKLAEDNEDFFKVLFLKDGEEVLVE
jgi:hypothetical protein